MKLFNKIIVCLVAVVVSATPLFAANQDSQELYHRGLGSFIYTEYEPLSELPIDVHYYIPTKGDIKGMRVLLLCTALVESLPTQLRLGVNLPRETALL